MGRVRIQRNEKVYVEFYLGELLKSIVDKIVIIIIMNFTWGNY